MTPSKLPTIVALFGLAASVAGHGYISSILANGQNYTGYLVDKYQYMTSPPQSIGWTTTATDLGFEAPAEYQEPNIICHRNGENAALSAPVTAGSDIELQWTTWPDSHHGPVITYLAACTNGDCSTVDKATLKFFKIAERGIVDNSNVPGAWATDELIAAGNRWTVTIPSTIAAGNYVMRHEIIALHSAGNLNGAQNYPQCINLQVTGGGSDVPAGTLGEALYTETDPGILISIYQTLSSYIIPGPALYSA
ncbi:hypothetical protein PENANT_c020G03637 [Penicillium antarcticum]|uniref:Auxiliary Activity family 9 catalytic domain-containing protein n=1 Tax=Penicillium antarcticum TaxID=416450 RepID=A0A1V6Q116_9EURO|nr:Glycoside hydrolase family 61 [Penicillium antarcticum]KAJ5309008.1 Glycoside hydrolase family 61 [Penicillium antarcticum]OQD82747.1 hypothetical protein PENANT_c020G03637 [Penicillium antarcticum]